MASFDDFENFHIPNALNHWFMHQKPVIISNNNAAVAVAGNRLVNVIGSFDIVTSTSGNQTILVKGNSDTINAGPGFDHIILKGNNDTANAGSGFDTIKASGINDTLRSGTSFDILKGDNTTTLIYDTAISAGYHVTDLLIGGKVQVNLSEAELEQLAVKVHDNPSSNATNLVGLEKYLTTLTSASHHVTDYNHNFGLNFVGIDNKSVSAHIIDGPTVTSPAAVTTNENTTSSTINLFNGVTDPGNLFANAANLALQSATIVTSSQHGTLTAVKDISGHIIPGEFTYTPNANFSGTDSFTYLVNDGLASSLIPATASITVNGVPHAPNLVANFSSATPDQISSSASTVQVPLASLFSITAGDSNTPADALTFSLSGLPSTVTVFDNGTLLTNLNNISANQLGSISLENISTGITSFDLGVIATATAAIGGAHISTATTTIPIDTTLINATTTIPSGTTISVGDGATVLGGFGGGDTVLIQGYANVLLHGQGNTIEVRVPTTDTNAAFGLNVNGGEVISTVDPNVIAGNTLTFATDVSPFFTIAHTNSDGSALVEYEVMTPVPAGQSGENTPIILANGPEIDHTVSYSNISTVMGAGELAAGIPGETLVATNNPGSASGLTYTSSTGVVSPVDILNNSSLTGITDVISQLNPAQSEYVVITSGNFSSISGNQIALNAINSATGLPYFSAITSFNQLMSDQVPINTSIISSGTAFSLPNNVTLEMNGVSLADLSASMFVFADSPSVTIPAADYSLTPQTTLGATSSEPLDLTINPTSGAANTVVDIAVPFGTSVTNGVGGAAFTPDPVTGLFQLTVPQAENAAVVVPAGATVPIGVTVISYLGAGNTDPVYSSDNNNFFQIHDTAQITSSNVSHTFSGFNNSIAVIGSLISNDQITTTGSNNDVTFNDAFNFSDNLSSGSGNTVHVININSSGTITGTALSAGGSADNTLDVSQYIPSLSGLGGVLDVTLPNSSGTNGTVTYVAIEDIDGKTTDATITGITFSNINHAITGGADAINAGANGQTLEAMNNAGPANPNNLFPNSHLLNAINNATNTSYSTETFKIDPGSATTNQTYVIQGFNEDNNANATQGTVDFNLNDKLDLSAFPDITGPSAITVGPLPLGNNTFSNTTTQITATNAADHLTVNLVNFPYSAAIVSALESHIIFHH